MPVSKLIAGLAMLTLAAGVAAQATVPGGPPAGPPMREARVAPESFQRGAPLPAWVQRQAIPPTQRKDPIVVRLRDVQESIADTVVTFVDRATLVNDAAALGEIGQLQLGYVPQYQRMNLHSVRILRGDTVLDRTSSVDVRFLERETGFERGAYSGEVTVALVVPDVRVGDTLSLAYVVEGANPVFGGRYFEEFWWDWPVPTELRRVSISYPQGRELRWRLLADYRLGKPQPVITSEGGVRTLRFEERGIEALLPEPGVPDNYFEGRIVQVSEFASWNEVARWAEALFPPVEVMPAELDALVKKFGELPTADQRAAAALRWVQGEIRNFSVAIGESSHRPSPPDVVLQRRYGDCKDKVYLLLTLLRQLGVEATPMLVSQRLPRASARTLPSPWPFDHAIVQARVGGMVVYLDPTDQPQPVPLAALAQPMPAMRGLLGSATTMELTVVGDTLEPRPLVTDVEERMRFADLAPQGTLEARWVFDGERAELMRLLWPRLRPEQQRQEMLADYERRYPGIKLSEDSRVEDDLEHNRFALIRRFTVPKLAQPHDGGWVVSYFPWPLANSVGLPPKLERQFPLVATRYPMERRYRLTVEWPDTVRAAEDPATQVVDGKIFRAESRTSFRGSRHEFSVRLTTKGSDVAAADVPALVQDVKRLAGIVPGIVVVDKKMISAGPAPKPESAAEVNRRGMLERIENASGAIRSGLLKGDDLAKAYCRRARAFWKVELFAEALDDSAEALRIAPELGDAWDCRGDALLAIGDFVAADAAYSRALALNPSAARVPSFERGMTRFFLGRYDEAAADFARAAVPDEDGNVDSYAGLWQAVALLRAGNPLPAEMVAEVRRDPLGAWPRPALAMMTDVLSPQQMLAQVEKLQGDERTLALAEAWFYVGELHLVQGRPEAAREAFERCRAFGITSYYEHLAAGFELARLGKP